MAFNEDSRVKIPAILHLMRLGYKYISKYEQKRIEETNIFPDIFSHDPSPPNIRPCEFSDQRQRTEHLPKDFRAPQEVL